MQHGRPDYRWLLASHGTTRMSSTYGTQVTPGTDSYGSYVGLGLLDTALPHDAHGILIGWNTSFVTNQDKDTLLTVGWDTAGGTSYVDKIQHLLAGGVGALSSGNSELVYHFPIFIPAGSRVGVKASVHNATPGTLRAFGAVYGRPGNPHHPKPGKYVRTFGADTTNSRGTAITEGTVADGTYTLLGTVAALDNLWHWQLGMAGGDPAGGVAHTGDLAIGDGTTFRKVIEDQVLFTNANTAHTYSRIREQLNRASPGEGIYARMQCSGTAETTMTATAYAVGG